MKVLSRYGTVLLAMHCRISDLKESINGRWYSFWRANCAGVKYFAAHRLWAELRHKISLSAYTVYIIHAHSALVEGCHCTHVCWNRTFCWDYFGGLAFRKNELRPCDTGISISRSWRYPVKPGNILVTNICFARIARLLCIIFVPFLRRLFVLVMRIAQMLL